MKQELLGNLTKITTGKLDVNACDPNGKYPFFTCAELPYKINEYAYDTEAILVAGNGDLNVKYYHGKFNAYQRTYVIQIDKKEALFCKYLFYFMRGYIGNLRRMSIGGIIKYIKLNYLTDAKILLPPLNDQIRIATVLTRAERLIAKRKESIKALDELLKSTFLEMFGDPVRNENITIYEALSKGIILMHKDGNHGGKYPRKEDFGKEGVPFITAKSVNESGQIIIDAVDRLKDEKANKLTIGWIEKDDILLAHNATVGRVGYYNGLFDRALIGTSLTAYRPNQQYLNPKYLFWFLRSDYFQAQLFKGMGQATRNQVPITAQRELKIFIPPLPLQNQFAAIVEKVESIKAKQTQSLAELENLYVSLSQRAFKGELDLSGVGVERSLI